ncbi:MAG: hypothetical protein R3C19_00430 [Planctomycetaceae bacterium]
MAPPIAITGLVLATLFSFPSIAAADAPAVESFLLKGRLADGAESLQEAIRLNPDDQQARFSLGVVQFLQAVEGLGRDQYRYGLLAGRGRALPFMRLPIGENEDPEQVSYQKARQILIDLQQRLRQAEQTLAAIKASGVKLPLKIADAKLDFNGDGIGTDSESVWAVMQTLQQTARNQELPPTPDMTITFDDADAVWLRGYCHVLLALSDMVLAYDWQDQFERTAHLFYPNVDSPYEFLAEEGTGQFWGFNGQNILDLIAWLHTVNYEVTEPDRMRSALDHMETVIRLSRRSWELIQTETDDENEWIPNEKQTAAIPGLQVAQQVITGWHEFLDELEAILAGKKLVPFWRGIRGGFGPWDQNFPRNPKLGLNVRRMFTEPTRFDLALWAQGTALVPYLEEGDIIEPKEWQTMMEQFRGNFFQFALWFN